jgi:hypothetical protein
MKKRLRIPDGSSIQELAEFWDTLDVTDVLDELEEVTEPIFASEVKIIRPALSEEEIDERVIAEADDDSAWEEPIKVKREPVKLGSRK